MGIDIAKTCQALHCEDDPQIPKSPKVCKPIQIFFSSIHTTFIIHQPTMKLWMCYIYICICITYITKKKVMFEVRSAQIAWSIDGHITVVRTWMIGNIIEDLDRQFNAFLPRTSGKSGKGNSWTDISYVRMYVTLYICIYIYMCMCIYIIFLYCTVLPLYVWVICIQILATYNIYIYIYVYIICHSEFIRTLKGFRHQIRNFVRFVKVKDCN